MLEFHFKFVLKSGKLDHEYTKSFEEDRDVDVDSDVDDKDSGNGLSKRSHHNALERKRRDHIKESFNGLRDSVPSLQGEKTSRAQILNKATEYIQDVSRKNNADRQDIDELKKQNNQLEMRIRALEHAKQDGIFASRQNNSNDQELDVENDS
ncbi:protein max [Ciona intestinalis]|nr:protein max [Ciona intestinalis]|eukprot:XP_009858718.1 protein max [Ciona intestinalis]